MKAVICLIKLLISVLIRLWDWHRDRIDLKDRGPTIVAFGILCLALLFAGCAFDKLRFSVDKGNLNRPVQALPDSGPGAP